MSPLIANVTCVHKEGHEPQVSTVMLSGRPECRQKRGVGREKKKEQQNLRTVDPPKKSPNPEKPPLLGEFRSNIGH